MIAHEFCRGAVRVEVIETERFYKWVMSYGGSQVVYGEFTDLTLDIVSMFIEKTGRKVPCLSWDEFWGIRNRLLKEFKEKYGDRIGERNIYVAKRVMPRLVKSGLLGEDIEIVCSGAGEKSVHAYVYEEGKCRHEAYIYPIDIDHFIVCYIVANKCGMWHKIVGRLLESGLYIGNTGVSSELRIEVKGLDRLPEVIFDFHEELRKMYVLWALGGVGWE